MLDAVDLPQRLAQLGARYPAADPPMVADIVRAVLSTMRGDLTGQEAALLCEVEELAQTVANARAEIAKLRADDITDDHIPSATDELDAIVAHTAVATDIILECCEKLDALGPTLAGDAAQVLQDVTTRVYEACSFQDITGQRITKVVSTLKSIETKVAHIVEVFRRDSFGETQSAPAKENDAEISLLNGPQSDIDALLASFD
jgi:chemotaxis protein CheZ